MVAPLFFEHPGASVEKGSKATVERKKMAKLMMFIYGSVVIGVVALAGFLVLEMVSEYIHCLNFVRMC